MSMIAESDRTSLVLGNPRGRSASFPPHSGSTAPTMPFPPERSSALSGALRQGRRFSCISRRLCC